MLYGYSRGGNEASELGGGMVGAQDVVRRNYWNVLNARDMGVEGAKAFAEVYESGSNARIPNRSDYDPVDIKMDYWNSHKGRAIASEYCKTASQVEEKARQDHANGEIRVNLANHFNLEIRFNLN